MATTFNVQGPTGLYIKLQTPATTTASGFSLLGHTDNEDLISVSIDNMMDPYTSTESGKEPAALIYQGTVATITATLVKWDTAVKDTLNETIWAGVGGTLGSIGQNQYDDANFTNVSGLQVKIVPTSTSNIETYTYQFFKCHLESMQETGWGNAPKKLVLSIKATRNTTSANFLYTRT
tara:strand:+ start:1895 stop:2428 length:534 start_codon:yes stop_codon:yes gene_type:complete